MGKERQQPIKKQKKNRFFNLFFPPQYKLRFSFFTALFFYKIKKQF